MALSQSALAEILDAFRAGNGVGLFRESVRVASQEFIELEATDVIGAGLYERATNATGTGRGCWRPRPVMCPCDP